MHELKGRTEEGGDVGEEGKGLSGLTKHAERGPPKIRLSRGARRIALRAGPEDGGVETGEKARTGDPEKSEVAYP